MSKKLTKTKDNKLIKKCSVDEARESVFRCVKAVLGTEALLKNFADKIGNFDSLKEEGHQKMNEELTDLSFAFGVETGYAVSNSAGEPYEKLALEMKRGIEKEFDCQSISEKALVDLAVNAYIRNLRYSWKMNENQTYLGQKFDGYRNYLSKEIDRAQRHYISAIETLKCFKQSSLKVSVKTNNAFIGENQQFNNNQNNESK